MILTPVARSELDSLLRHFASHLRDRHAKAAFARIANSAPERAARSQAETHRLAATRLARQLGVVVREGSPPRNFGWDGRIMRARTEAYVLLHEVAHWQTAGPLRRHAFEFGLGPGPETGHRAAAERATLLTGLAREREEAMASLLGVLWEAALGQPALASFLDQNWLEGASRPGAARHFEATLARLMRARLVDLAGRPQIASVTRGLDPRVPGERRISPTARDRRVKPGDDERAN